MGITRTTGVLAATVLSLVGTAQVSRAAPEAPVVSRIELNSVYQISHDGRWLRGVRNGVGEVILDRQSGAITALGDDDGNANWIVRDNPRFRLSRQGWEIHARDASVHLIDAVTGIRTRIDTDSKGRPLVPTWRGVEFEFSTEWNDFDDSPQLLISAASVSRSGRKAAFCANYDVPAKPFLYVKDLVTGRLTRTKVVCGAVRDETDYLRGDRGPEMSDDGRVVHVNGDEFRPSGGRTTAWLGDTLYFTGSGRSRSIKGWGTMTRDGRTILMRVGVHRPGTPDRTGGRVGAYTVTTGRTTRLPGRDLIYGNDPFTFSACDQASRRGRFIVNSTSIVDRTYGITTDVRAILSQQGFVPFPTEDPGDSSYLRLSGDGTAVVAPIMLPDPQGDGTTNAGIYNEVVVTGWQPAANVAMSANTAGSKLVVDVDPNKGRGYWVFQMQRQEPDGSWRTLAKKYRTRGSGETRIVDLPAGTFRARVKAKFGYQGAVSAPIALTE